MIIESDIKVCTKPDVSYTYGCYQSSGTACIFYKRDEEDHQSTFNAFVSPEKDADEKKEIVVIIDNDQIKKQSFWRTTGLDVGDVYREYGTWSSGAPPDFDLQAKKSLGNLLRSELRVVDVSKEIEVVGKADVKVMGAKGSYRKKKELKSK